MQRLCAKLELVTGKALHDPKTVNDLAKLKFSDPAAYVGLMAMWKKSREPDLTGLRKAVDERIKAVLAKNAEKAKEERDEDDFLRDDSGKVIANRANSLLALDKQGVKLAYDRFNGMPVQQGLSERFGEILDDPGMNRMWSSVEQYYGFRPSLGNFQIWVSDAAYQNDYHPVLDYLDSLEWDGVKRIDSWLTDFCQVEATPYTKAVGAIVLMAAVRRVRQPGVKFDEMLILESAEQGLGKSTAVSILAKKEEWFSDSIRLNVSEKEMMESTGGVWICEVGELQGLRKGEAEVLKAQLSRGTDRARLAYGRLPSRQPRQCIFIGTTNGGQTSAYLTDASGNRRMWPVQVNGPIDLVGLRKAVDQLWAEACVREAAGGKEAIRLPPALWEAARAEQSKREVGNVFTEQLEESLGSKQGIIISTDLWRLLGINIDRRHPHQASVSQAMHALGWTTDKAYINKEEKRVWRKGKGHALIAVVPDGVNPYHMVARYLTDVVADANAEMGSIEQDEPEATS